MTYFVDVSIESGRIPLSRDKIAAAVESVLRAERERTATVAVTFVTTPVIRKLNAEHFGRRSATDVISTGWRSPTTGLLVGDIYIAPDVARENARRAGAGLREELLRLVVHGVLHAVGYDHPEDDARMDSPMWRRQERLLGRLRQSLSLV